MYVHCSVKFQMAISRLSRRRFLQAYIHCSAYFALHKICTLQAIVFFVLHCVPVVVLQRLSWFQYKNMSAHFQFLLFSSFILFLSYRLRCSVPSKTSERVKYNTRPPVTRLLTWGRPR